MSAISFVNAFYILRKSYDKEELYNAMSSLAKLCTITPTDEEMVNDCLKIKAEDFEDAIQVKSAQAMKADVIVTRNKKDFILFNLKVQAPEEFLDDYFKE